MTAPDVSSIPAEIKGIPHWVNWKWEQRADRTTGELKMTKPPYQPNGQHAESDNPTTWATFQQAVAAYEKGDFSGIGFVLTKDDGFAGVDLDHVHDPETGVIEDWAMIVVQRLDSYTEISPSGTGLRIFLRAKLPPKDRKINGFECYENGRYLTVTGNHLEGTPTTIEHRQAEMEAVHTEMFAERNRPRSNGKGSVTSVLPNLDDQELLDKAFRAKNGEAIWRLFHGDMSGYQSHSEADLALCGLLAFYTGPDQEKLDRIYRSSDLVSPKWDEPRGGSTWGEMTMNKALEGKTEFYSPIGRTSNGHSSGLNTFNTFNAYPQVESRKWPDQMAEEAFQGLAGDVVRVIEPHTEASREALLINFLVAFGNAVGTGPHALAEADKHGCNTFAVLVGQTSKGRKGSSWSHIRELFKRADPEWADNRILGG
jgi:primase-polymerase (primpol)-like protein